MLVLPMDKIAPSESMYTPTLVKTRQQQVLKDKQIHKLIIPRKTFDTSMNRVFQQIEQRDKIMALRKAWLKKQHESQVVTRDSLYNIYAGNPGLYSTEGDTIGFGNVPYLSDSLFHVRQNTITEKSGKPYGIEGKMINLPKQDWVLGIVLIAWIIFASVKIGFSKYLNQLIGGLVNYGISTRLYRERSYKTMYGAIRLNFLFYLVLPLSAFQILHYYNIDLPGYHDFFLFLILLIVINAYFFIKIILNRMIGSMVMLKDEVDESVYHMQMYYKVLGVFLLPVVTLHAVADNVRDVTIWIMVIIIALFYFGSVIRSIYIGNRKGISIFLFDFVPLHARNSTIDFNF